MKIMRTNEKARTFSVFLSYDNIDVETARQIRNWVGNHVDARVWMDEDVLLGESWKSKLQHAIRDADVLLVLLTPHALDSSWVLQEVGGAWALDKPIVSIVSERQLLNRFSLALEPDNSIELADFENTAEGKQRLATLLETARERVPSV